LSFQSQETASAQGCHSSPATVWEQGRGSASSPPSWQVQITHRLSLSSLSSSFLPKIRAILKETHLELYSMTEVQLCW